MLGAAVLVLLINIIVNRLKPRDAEPDPWNGQTLEWQISSPPPVYGFFAPPLVQSREPAQHIADPKLFPDVVQRARSDRKSTRLNSSHVAISYAVFCLKK